jgi:D-glycero-alpha-D-manno-heptose-7-phosphate kinase
MIISRTPFRISFFGGGTDYPARYREHGGSVLATTIDKYCYISCRYLPPFFDYKHRVVYSKIENANEIGDIVHPSVRATFGYMKVKSGREIHHDGDLPARTGLGSSSSFTVGLLHSLYAQRGVMPTKMQLAREAIHIEQNIIKESVGSQDQVSASFGGFNLIRFETDDTIQVSPIIISRERLDELQSSIMLYFTGFSRYSSDIAGDKIKNIPKKEQDLSTMHDMVSEALDILNHKDRDIGDFGKLLNESWNLKRGLSNKVSNNHIDDIYEAAMKAGALGGKLLGAGGGGFIIFFARTQEQPRIAEKLKHLLRVPFSFENQGSQIIVYQPNGLY